jgi:hypothetical protein
MSSAPAPSSATYSAGDRPPQETGAAAAAIRIRWAVNEACHVLCITTQQGNRPRGVSKIAAKEAAVAEPAAGLQGLAGTGFWVQTLWPHKPEAYSTAKLSCTVSQPVVAEQSCSNICNQS